MAMLWMEEAENLKQLRMAFLHILWSILRKKNSNAWLALELAHSSGRKGCYGRFHKDVVWGKRAVVCKEESITEFNCTDQESFKPGSFLSPS